MVCAKQDEPDFIRSSWRIVPSWCKLLAILPDHGILARKTPTQLCTRTAYFHSNWCAFADHPSFSGKSPHSDTSPMYSIASPNTLCDTPTKTTPRRYILPIGTVRCSRRMLFGSSCLSSANHANSTLFVLTPALHKSTTKSPRKCQDSLLEA